MMRWALSRRPVGTINVLALYLMVMMLAAACGGTASQVQPLEETDRRASIYEAYTRAELARHLGDLEAAVGWARQAVDLAPRDGHLALLLGELLRLDERYEEAIAVLTRAIRSVADPLPLLLERATTEELAGDPEAAEESYQAALDLSPDNLAAVGPYAEFAARVGTRARAVEILETYLARRPDDAAGWRLLGSTQMNGRQTGAALDAYRRAAELEPRVEDDYVPLLRLAREAEEHALADALAEECFHTYRQNVACRIEYIRGLEARDLPEQERAEHTHHALQSLARAIGANPGALRRVERRLIRELDAERALVFIASIAADRPRNSQIQARAAWAAYRVGDEEMACFYMARVLEVNPRSADALNFIGYSYAERGIRLEEAEQLVLRALEVRPHDGNIQDSLGWVYYKKGRYEEAVHWLQRAVTNIPDNAVLRDHLADAYRALGDFQGALKQYRVARTLADDDLRQTIQAKIDEIEAHLTSHTP